MSRVGGSWDQTYVHGTKAAGDTMHAMPLIVDISPGTITVDCVTGNSTLILLGVCTVLGALGGFLYLRTRRRIEQKVAGAAAPETRTKDETTTGTGKREPRIERVTTAYENGEIDERMLHTAARVLGIEKEEARRRLESTAGIDTSLETSGRVKDRADTRTRNRKKNKQAKRSRQTNRR